MASAMGTVLAFQQPTLTSTRSLSRKSTSLMVTVDPSTITKKDYEDICGVSFTEDELEARLSRTNFLYPKHVEVIEDIAPIAGKMVDELVSECCRVRVGSYRVS